MTTIVPLIYIVSAIFFIFGLKYMTHPRTAVKGNLLAVIGMTLATVVALINLNNYWLLIVGAVIGATIGALLAIRVALTEMPQLVALFNGFGGAASILVAGAAMWQEADDNTISLLATGVTGIIGAVTFWGSLVAFGKLQGLALFSKPIKVPGQHAINALLAVVILLLTVMLATLGASFEWLYLPIILFASVLGLMLVNPIGGADMPVVIALLNSYSGLAGAAAGFAMGNIVLIISGSLVGASGLILTQLMCKAMNRSLFNVLFGVMDASSSASADDVYANVRSTTADDVAMILDGAQKVVIVPGFGLAVAQAQHAVKNLANLLEKNDTEVEYAIHPVAGRMPGHMNVLLAEADVPYDQLKEMDEINRTIETADVAIVIGANDVVNPVARTDPKSPIAGMPIIDVDKARTVIVIKRSLSPGFAGIPNPLFAAENTLMFYGDGQKALNEIISAMEE